MTYLEPLPADNHAGQHCRDTGQPYTQSFSSIECTEDTRRTNGLVAKTDEATPSVILQPLKNPCHSVKIGNQPTLVSLPSGVPWLQRQPRILRLECHSLMGKFLGVTLSANGQTVPALTSSPATLSRSHVAMVFYLSSRYYMTYSGH